MESTSITYWDLRERLGAFLSNEEPVDALVRWLAPVCWNEDTVEDARVADLARDLGLLCAEYGEGHADEAEFRDFVRGALCSTKVDVAFHRLGATVILTATSSGARKSPWLAGGSALDRFSSTTFGGTVPVPFWDAPILAGDDERSLPPSRREVAIAS